MPVRLFPPQSPPVAITSLGQAVKLPLDPGAGFANSGKEAAAAGPADRFNLNE